MNQFHPPKFDIIKNIIISMYVLPAVHITVQVNVWPLSDNTVKCEAWRINTRYFSGCYFRQK